MTTHHLCLRCGHPESEHILLTENGRGCMAEDSYPTRYCLCSSFTWAPGIHASDRTPGRPVTPVPAKPGALHMCRSSLVRGWAWDAADGKQR